MINTTRFTQSFDANSDGYSDETNGWSGTTTEVASGFGGITSADGTGHSIFVQTDADANLTGPFTRFDSYRALTSEQAFTAEIKIYLDPLAWSAGEGFDYSVAANGQNGSHLRDFIFHVTQDTSTGNLLVGASNNTNFDPREDLETINNAQITQAGWYTFRHTFQDSGSDTLEVTMEVLDSSGSVVFTEVRDNGDVYSTDFGGNRYGWFTNIDVAGGIAVDSASLATENSDPVQVRNSAGNVVATFETIEQAIAVIDFGALTDTTFRISTTGLDDEFFYVSTMMSIQDAVDAAAEGDDIRIADGTFTESVNVTTAVNFIGEGANTTVIAPGGGAAFDLTGDLGTDATVSFDNISFQGGTVGVDFDDNAILGTLQITNSEFSANSFNGVRIGGNLSPVDLDNVIITDSTFTGNGQPQSSSGDGDILFFQYYGNATLQNLTITGQDRGTGPAENAIQFRGDAGSLGTVSLDNITIDGIYEKQVIGIFNYDDVNGLSASNVTITADTTSFNLATNIDGVGGDIDFAALGIDATGSPDPVALQGGAGAGAQTISSGDEDAFLRGRDGDDTLEGGNGTDTAGYAGSSSDYSFTATRGVDGRITGFTGVTDDNVGDGDEGTDSLSSIENLFFFGDGVTLGVDTPVQVFDDMGNFVGGFATIQEGVDAASDGAEILVGAGTFREQITVSGLSDVTIRGAGATTIIEMIDSPAVTAPATSGESVIAVLNSSNITIEDVTVDGRGLGSSAQYYGVYWEDSSGTLDNSTVTGIRAPLQMDGTPQGSQIGRAVFANNTDMVARTLNITNNTVEDFQKNGLDLRGEGLTVNVTGNTIVGSGFLPAPNAIAQNGIALVFGPTGVISGNTISEIGFARGDFVTVGILGFAAGDGVEVTNNTIIGPLDGGGAAIPATHVGILFGSGESDDLVITGNTIDGALDGIRLSDNVDNPTVSGNTFQNMVASVATEDPGGTGVETGANIIYRGDDNDAAVNIALSIGADAADGTSFDDTISGDAGFDTIDGGDGDDNINGGAQADNIEGGDGNDTVVGGTGADFISSGLGDDDVSGGANDDVIFAGIGDDTVIGGDQNDRIFGGLGFDELSGDNGDDFIQGDTSADVIFGGEGVDTITGGQGADFLAGDNGNDNISGDTENDVIFGGFGNDTLNGNANDDRLLAGIGFDSLDGGDGNDELSGGDQADNLLGGTGDDTIEGGQGADRLFGQTGSDLMLGGTENDALFGGAGFDTLEGGAGNDRLTGNFNWDIFIFADGFGNDTITDFDVFNSFEVIDLSAVTGITDFVDLVVNHLSDDGMGNAVITDVANSITLMGVDLNDLSGNDFIF